MLNHQKVALIIPFFNEAKNLSEVVRTIPAFVDFVILVDDGSTDDSVLTVMDTINQCKIPNRMIVGSFSEIQNMIVDSNQSYSEKLYLIVKHSRNMGKGAGVKSGYLIAVSLDAPCIATMDGDGQMNPDELLSLCLPIVNNQADYTKGNRLKYPDFHKIIPSVRLIGIYILAYMTRICSGYHFIQDAQSGYTAIHLSQLKKMDISTIYDKYGYVNDVLVRLSVLNSHVMEVPITPIYKEERVSKMNILIVIPKISFLMLKMFFWKQYYLLFKKD